MLVCLFIFPNDLVLFLLWVVCNIFFLFYKRQVKNIEIGRIKLPHVLIYQASNSNWSIMTEVLYFPITQEILKLIKRTFSSYNNVL